MAAVAIERAPVGTPYRMPIAKNVTAVGQVEPPCDHVEGVCVCLTCKQFLDGKREIAVHTAKRPKHGDSHKLAWWCARCDEPTFLVFDPKEGC